MNWSTAHRHRQNGCCATASRRYMHLSGASSGISIAAPRAGSSDRISPCRLGRPGSARSPRTHRHPDKSAPRRVHIGCLRHFLQRLAALWPYTAAAYFHRIKRSHDYELTGKSGSCSFPFLRFILSFLYFGVTCPLRDRNKTDASRYVCCLLNADQQVLGCFAFFTHAAWTMVDLR
ncbi:uncharacterized protein BO80DRAFT_181548 [Aspergillus ibericus CBS 121593]|uniref:Uncharacterized protein n=1 Tax=Aspergillus ibericus CBS 121593 TaxID=1448316 RepID=A0A395GQJ6_9EURO|nr:hypothetical protein BO80DRAFT_181548 [Aspergillus ibericus CBS 121593]RAK97811.1 hypothetical protein BO80DRAFT_181548 [Aspergillus ibericus CBS 121593]